LKLRLQCDGGKSPEAAAAAAQSLAPKDAPQVKQIRLDKIIAFDVVRGDADGKLTLANIQGIFSMSVSG